MEIGDYAVRNRKTVRRENEFVGPSVERLHLVVCSDKGFQTADDGNTHCQHFVAGILGGIDQLCRLRGDNEPLGIHLVLGQVLHIHRTEMAYAHMQGNVSLVDILEYHSVEEFPAEMQTCRRSANRTFLRSKNGLIALGILGSHLRFHPLRNRGLTERVEHALELLITSVVEETESSAATGCVVYDLSNEGIVFSKIEFVSDTDFACRVHDYIPEPLLTVQFPQKKNLDIGPGLLLFAIESCRENFRIVENEGVALFEVVDDILEQPVLYFSRILVENHKFALVAPIGRLGGNFVCCKIEFEL